MPAAWKAESKHEQINPYSDIFMKSAAAGDGSDYPHYTMDYDSEVNQQE